MTVPTSDNREEYIGNDTTTVFPYAFKIFRNEDLQVYVVESDSQTLQTLGTDYSVSGAGHEDGGNVTMTTAPTANQELIILRIVEIVQETDLRNQGAYYPETVEDEFDRSRMIDQQQQDEIDRTLSRPEALDYWDAQDRVIRNVADGVEDDDAVSKGQMDARFTNDVITKTGSHWDGKGLQARNFTTRNPPSANDLMTFSALQSYVADIESGAVGDATQVTASGTGDKRTLADWMKALGYPATATGTQTLTEALDQRTIYVAHYDDMLLLDTLALTSGQQINIKGSTFEWDGAEFLPRGPISVIAFGAVPDGVDTGEAFTGTDNKSAFQSALDWAGERGYALYVPSGKYRIAPVTVDDTAYLTFNHSKHILIGDGAEMLIDDDAPTTYALLDFIRTPNLDTSTNLDDRELLSIAGVTFRGRWSHSNTYAGPNVLNVQNFARVELHNVKAFDIRAKFSRSKYIGSLNVDNFYARRIASDCLRFKDTPHVTMNNITMIEVDDDCIALPISAASPDDGRQQIALSNISLTKCEGILILGARNVAISNATLRLCHGTQIYLGGKVVNEGDTAPFGASLSNISIIDPLNRAADGSNGVPATSLATSLTGALVIAGIQPTSVTTGAKPEHWDSVAGAVVLPYGTDSNGDPIAYNFGSTVETLNPGFNYSVSNFTVMRTVPDTAAYSSWGFGLAFNRYGFFDPSVSTVNFATSGVELVGSLKNVAISNGSIHGLSMGSAVSLRSNADSPATRHREFENISIANVVGKDVKHGVSHTAVQAGDMFTWSVNIRDCDFDCDPYATSSARTVPVDGSWQDGVSQFDRPIGIHMRQAEGWTIRGCNFANCYDPVLGNADFAEQADVTDNMVRCRPAALGYSLSNIGIAVIPEAGGAFRLIHIDSDPTSGTYMQVLNCCVTESSSIPTLGRYIRGHFVKNRNPNITTGKVLLGWLRLTTGNDHVADTDWAALFATNA